MTQPPSRAFPGWTSRRQSWHFQRRLYERYGIVLGFGEYTMLLRDVQQGRAERIARDLWRGSAVYRLWHRDTQQEVQVVRNETDGLFITALKPASFVRRGKRWTKARAAA
jgi:hypothetical protein